MDYIFSHLTDIGLRRLYKFILKRALGKYLQDELLIEQLQVVSREGIVRLSDICFDVNILNDEFLSKSPLKIVAMTISELEVHISYKTLLTDSCRFIVDSVEIVLAPNENYAEAVRSGARKDTGVSSPVSGVISSGREGIGRDGRDSAKDNDQDVDHNEDDDFSDDSQQDGTSFIANWIEIIIARLQVSVKQLSVVLEGNTIPSSASKTARGHRTSGLASAKASASVGIPAVEVVLTGIDFFNDDPRAISERDGNALDLSSRLSTGKASAVQINLGARKVIND